MPSCDFHHYQMMNVSQCSIAISHGHMTTQHCKLSQVISINTWCITTVLIMKNASVSTSQNVKDRLHVNKYPRKIKVNLPTTVGICISTYSNADVVCYSATWRMELNSVGLIVNGSKKLTKKSHFKLAVGHTTKQMKHGRLRDIQI